MNEPSTPTPAPDAAAAQAASVPTAQSPADLIARRQALRLAVGDVAQRLKLSPRQVEAIESGDWAALPGHAFVRGVLRGYGRLLGVDVSALLGQVGAGAEPLRSSISLREPMPRRGASRPDSGAGGRLGGMARVALAVAVLAALALYFGRVGDLSEIHSWIGASSDGRAPAESDAQSDALPAGRAAGAISEAPGGATGIGPAAGPSDAAGTPPPLVPSAPAAGAAGERR